MLWYALAAALAKYPYLTYAANVRIAKRFTGYHDGANIEKVQYVVTCLNIKVIMSGYCT